MDAAWKWWQGSTQGPLLKPSHVLQPDPSPSHSSPSTRIRLYCLTSSKFSFVFFSQPIISINCPTTPSPFHLHKISHPINKLKSQPTQHSTNSPHSNAVVLRNPKHHQTRPVALTATPPPHHHIVIIIPPTAAVTAQAWNQAGVPSRPTPRIRH